MSSNFMVNSEVENAMAAEVLGLVMVDRVFKAMRNLLGDRDP
jgi:hypothetical protein